VCSRRVTGSFIGTNAFGVRKRIEVVDLAELGIKSTSENSYGYAIEDVDVSMGPAEAQQAKPYLEVILVIRPGAGRQSALTWTASDRTTATIDDPEEEHITTFGIGTVEAQAWVADLRTGTVLAKKTLWQDPASAVEQ
jgi:hypothetical protein